MSRCPDEQQTNNEPDDIVFHFITSLVCFRAVHMRHSTPRLQPPITHARTTCRLSRTGVSEYRKTQTSAQFSRKSVQCLTGDFEDKRDAGPWLARQHFNFYPPNNPHPQTSLHLQSLNYQNAFPHWRSQAQFCKSAFYDILPHLLTQLSLKVRFGHAAHRLEQRDDSASHCDGDDGNPTSTIDLSAGFGSGVHDDEPENHDDDLRRLRRRNCNGVNTDYGKIRMWIGDGNATLHNHYATPWSSGYTGDSAGDIPQGLPFGGRPAGGFQRDKIFGSR